MFFENKQSKTKKLFITVNNLFYFNLKKDLIDIFNLKLKKYVFKFCVHFVSHKKTYFPIQYDADQRIPRICFFRSIKCTHNLNADFFNFILKISTKFFFIIQINHIIYSNK